MIMALWGACQLTMFIMFVYAFFKRELSLTGENLAITSTMLAFGPLALSAVFAIMIYEHLTEKKRRKCNAAVARWEQLARTGSSSRLVQPWGWHMDKKLAEERYNLLRTAIRKIPYKDLDLLLRVSKSTFEVEAPIREAIVDELIERRILDND